MDTDKPSTATQWATRPSQRGPNGRAPVEAPRPDLTGRDRLVTNVLATWASHLVFIVAGFILPRMIDNRLTQDALGVWDFAWAFVGYFNLVQGGIVGSVARYVAEYRASGNVEGVNRMVSSASLLFSVLGAMVFIATVAVTFALPSLLGDQLRGHLRDAQWVIFLLGLSVVIQIGASGTGGVVTGCHRWDLHNAIHAGAHVLASGGMVVVLFLGGGLPWLAAAAVCGEAVDRGARWVLAYRLFPELQIRFANVRRTEITRMLAFGGKSVFPQVADLLLNQTTSVLILAYLGPAALALYSRPRALIRQVVTILAKYARVLMSTSSSLIATGQLDALRALLIKSTRYAIYIALPMIVFLAIMGEPILRLWMGPGYAGGGAILAILAVGHLASLALRPIQSVLAGLNAHGRPGLANFVAALCSSALTLVALGPLQWGLMGTALAVVIPMTIANGVYVTIYGCRRLQLPIRRFILNASLGPILCALPFALSLTAARVAFSHRPFAGLMFGGGLGAGVLAVLYWRQALPISLKKRVTEGLLRKWPLRSIEPT